MKLEEILVGLDLDGGGALTPGSRVAARSGLWIAARTGARVTFLHSTWVDDDGPPPPDLEALSKLEGVISEVCIEFDGGELCWELVLTEERPWLAITRRVLEGHGDLVVVAKRSHTKSDDRRLGSVSMKLVRNCPGPVLVVRPDQPERCRGVLAATDLTPVGDLAVRWGALVATEEQCDLWVAHAWQVPMALQLEASRLEPEEVRARRAAIADAARDQIEALPEVAALGARAHTLLACDSPSRLIAEAVKEKRPDLVVLGTVSRTGVPGLIVGNTAERLIYRLDTSLLTVKPEGFECPVHVVD